MKYLFVSFSALILFGCGLSPVHLYQGDAKPVEQLSSVSGKGSEVKLLKIDGVEIENSDFREYFLNPGKHEIVVALHWQTDVYNGYETYSYTATSNNLNTVCIDMQAGEKYTVRATGPEESWDPIVLEPEAGKVPHAC